MCGYAYPYPVNQNNNDGFNSWWAIFIVLLLFSSYSGDLMETIIDKRLFKKQGMMWTPNRRHQ